MVVGVLGVFGGGGAWLGLLLCGPEAEQGGEGLVEIAVVAGGVAGKLGKHLGGIDQFAVTEGVAEGYGAVVRVGHLRVGGGLGEQGLGNGVVGVVDQAGLEDAEAVASPGGGDHVVD